MSIKKTDCPPGWM